MPEKIRAIYKRVLSWFAKPEKPEEESYFLAFKCEECDSQLLLKSEIDYGQVAVIECENCGENWVVYSPPLEVHKVKEFEPVWSHLPQ